MKENNKRYALILAGGKGSRLWPISTTNKPKQYLNLYSNNIMINETIKRIESIFEYDNIFVITNIEQKELAERYIDNRIPRENIIFEPMSKNTAMCIFFASIRILEQRENGTITILSSDHYIDETEKLLNNIEEGIELANKEENLVTIGIKPTYPATGFGYIKYNYDDDLKCNIVEEFKEKPIYEKAREYIGDTNEKVVFDLYSGTGTIAQILAPVAKKVVGVEIVEEAVEAAKVNAKLNGLDNCTFWAGDVLKVIDELGEVPDLIMLDPPRDGIHPKALPKILSYGVNRIVYVSCKATSLARDLEAFLAAGYRLEKACCVDQFCETVWTEAVALLVKE